MGIIVLLLAIGALSYYYVRHGSLPSMPEFLKQRRLDNDVVEHASPPTAAPTAYERPSPESVAYLVPDAVASDDVGAWHHYPNTDHVGNDIEHLPQFAGNVLELQRRCRPSISDVESEVVCFRLEKFAFLQLDAEVIFLTDGVEFSE